MKKFIFILFIAMTLSGCIKYVPITKTDTIKVESVKATEEGVLVTFMGDTGNTIHGDVVWTKFSVKYEKQPEWAVVGNKVKIVGE